MFNVCLKVIESNKLLFFYTTFLFLSISLSLVGIKKRRNDEYKTLLIGFSLKVYIVTFNTFLFFYPSLSPDE